jgi:hypothetical protein
MKTLLSFIVVTTFTTFTLTAQESTEQTFITKNAEEVSVHKINANEEIRGRVITDLNKTTGTPVDPSITLYPNPSSDILNISFYSNSQSNVMIEILDILGRKIVEENFNAQIGNNVHSVFISRFKNGLYYINFKNEQGATTQRFTKN